MGVGGVLGPRICHARLEECLLACSSCFDHSSLWSMRLCTRGVRLFASLQLDA